MMKVPFIDINFSGLPGILVKVFNMVDLIHSQALWGGGEMKPKNLTFLSMVCMIMFNN